MTQRQRLTREDLPVGEILASQGLGADSGAVVYVTGSLVEGFGNSSSDIDVYIVTEDRPRQELQIEVRDFSIVIDYLGERRLDIEYWQPESLHRLAQTLADFDPERHRGTPLELPEQKLIHGLRNGIAILDEDGFAALRGRFDFSKFRGYLLRRAILELDNAVDDLYGMIDDDQREVGIFRARDVLDYAVDAWNYHRGNTIPTTKWRVWILRSLLPEESSQRILEQYLSLQFPDPGPLLSERDACGEYMTRCLEFSESIVHQIQS